MPDSGYSRLIDTNTLAQHTAYLAFDRKIWYIIDLTATTGGLTGNGPGQWFVAGRHAIQDNGNPVPVRTNLNIVGGTFDDDAPSDTTTVTFTGGSSISSDAFTLRYELEDISEAGGGTDLTNAGAVTFGPGAVGNGAIFDGNSSKSLSLPDSPLTQFGDKDWSISLWATPASIAGFQAILNKDSPPSVREFVIYMNGANIQVLVGAGNASSEDRVLGVAVAGQTYHLGVTYEKASNTLKGYFNGAEVFSVNPAFTLGISSSGFELGKRSTGGTLSFDGVIDQVIKDDSVFSGVNISTLYNGGTGQVDPAAALGLTAPTPSGSGLVHQETPPTDTTVFWFIPSLVALAVYDTQSNSWVQI